jgi:hypothetical protein
LVSAILKQGARTARVAQQCRHHAVKVINVNLAVQRQVRSALIVRGCALWIKICIHETPGDAIGAVRAAAAVAILNVATVDHAVVVEIARHATIRFKYTRVIRDSDVAGGQVCDIQIDQIGLAVTIKITGS